MRAYIFKQRKVEWKKNERTKSPGMLKLNENINKEVRKAKKLNEHISVHSKLSKWKKYFKKRATVIKSSSTFSDGRQYNSVTLLLWFFSPFVAVYLHFILFYVIFSTLFSILLFVFVFIFFFRKFKPFDELWCHGCFNERN